jgi:hypothetical protein
MLRLIALKSLVLLIFFTFNSQGLANDTTYVDTAKISDTILYLPQGIEGSGIGVVDSTDYERRLTQNPTIALFKSMLVPGWGQFGNRKYVKAVVALGLDAWFVSSAIRHGQDASDLHRQFEESTDLNERNELYSRYLDSKDDRNKFTWFAVIVTFVSMFDAFSDAHLSGFPKDPMEKNGAIELNFEPVRDGGIYASVSYAF